MFNHWIWRLLGWVIAVAVGAGVTLWIYKKQSYKALSYSVVSISPLGPLQARGFKDLRLLKGDKPIERPFLITIRVSNIGDLDIAPSDFAMPLTIKPLGYAQILFPANAQIDSTKLKGGWISSSTIFELMESKGPAATTPAHVADARVAATEPPQIPVQLEITTTQVLVRPLLLNRGDAFTLELLINGDVRGIEVSGRIAGIKQISEESREKPTESRWLGSWPEWLALLGFCLAAFASGGLISKRK